MLNTLAGAIKPGSVSRGLFQNTDFVPTWFELAQAETPVDYHMDGESLVPMFKDPSVSIRQYIYAEQGPARAIKTADWEYITIRYTDEQVAATQGNRADRAFKTFARLERWNFRAKDFHPGTFSADQLYHLSYGASHKRTWQRI